MEKILEGLNLEHLVVDFVTTTRLGRMETSKIRPLRIQFRSNWVREKIIKKSWMLKYSLKYCSPNYPYGVFINRDLTQEERVAEKEAYLRKKQQQNASNNVGNVVPGTVSVSEPVQGSLGLTIDTNNQTLPQLEGGANVT